MVPDAESLPPDCASAQGWRSQPMDAVADDTPGTAVSQAARIDRTSLAGPFQGIPVPGRFPFSDGASLCRAKRPEGRTCQQGRGMEIRFLVL